MTRVRANKSKEKKMQTKLLVIEIAIPMLMLTGPNHTSWLFVIMINKALSLLLSNKATRSSHGWTKYPCTYFALKCPSAESRGHEAKRIITYLWRRVWLDVAYWRIIWMLLQLHYLCECNLCMRYYGA